LNNFPVKIQTDAQDRNTTMSFKNVSLAKPDASLFEVPPGYTSYDSMQSMMQQQMMKQMGGGGFSPFGH
jgi:chemotaxis protein CheY-P-specific phosphatase CheC